MAKLQDSKEAAKSIYHVDDDCQYVITSTPDFGILKSLGIVENTSILKKMTHGMGGPVLLMIESSQIAIGKDIAEKIMVRGVN